MLVEWLNWVRSMRTDELLLILGVLLLVDAPRYAYSALIMAFWDTVKGLWTGRFPGHQTESYTYTPPVSVIIVGYNEADTIARTMESVWNRYPCKQLIVVDDGSTDGMTEAAMTFAQDRPGVTVIRRDRRGGKSSALNLGLHYATEEVIVTVDADSKLSDDAIYGSSGSLVAV